MPLVLNEEQRLLRDTAHQFLANNSPVSALRKLRDEKHPVGYEAGLWLQMADLGWSGIILPREYGGLDFGFTGMGVIMQECGRTLAASPLFATAVVGASTLLLGGSDTQKAELLPAIASGDITLALALEESHHHCPSSIATTAEIHGDSFLLSGNKTFVLDGHSADRLIVVTRTHGDQHSRDGLSLFLVDGNSAGITCRRTLMVDSRNAANLSFDRVRVPRSAQIGRSGEGWELLDQVLDRGRVAIAAEMMGCALEAFERTVAYLKERKQFGVFIGSFQALQHRAARMQADIELCRSVLLQALGAVDETPEQLPMLASLAKAKLNELVKHVTNEAVQMHGGIGVTDELEIGFFLKRARATMQIFGDTGFHRDRYATLCGY